MNQKHNSRNTLHNNMEFSKKSFLQQYLAKKRELSRRQREYKQVLNDKPRVAPEAKSCAAKWGHRPIVKEANIKSNSQLLQVEEKELKAQLWASMGHLHQTSDAKNLNAVKCHVECQERLTEDIQQIKSDINNMRREISRVTRDIYVINREIVPDAMHQLYVAAARKKLQILENQLEVGMRRECIFTAHNAELRRQLIDNIHFRRHFHDSYTKMVEQLNSDRKYIMELIEYVLNIYENSIQVSEKIINHKRDTKKKDQQYADFMNKLKHDESIAMNVLNFQHIKGNNRELADLQPKEYKRRDRWRKHYADKIAEYIDIMDKIMKYTSANDIAGVIEKFKEQESLYYSYFSYANEMSYHMTLLNNSVSNLFGTIQLLKNTKSDEIENDNYLIQQLTETLRERRQSNSKLLTQRNNHDARINSLLDSIGELFLITNCDATSLLEMLGDNTVVNLVNVRKFLKVLEQRIIDIIATVYVTERSETERESRPSAPAEKTVQDLSHRCDEITKLDEIVLAQQCPECAEGEAVYDVDGGMTYIPKREEFRKQLYEKIKQPEMQYRLHSISQCRLPRSRILAAKR